MSGMSVRHRCVGHWRCRGGRYPASRIWLRILRIAAVFFPAVCDPLGCHMPFPEPRRASSRRHSVYWAQRHRIRRPNAGERQNSRRATRCYPTQGVGVTTVHDKGKQHDCIGVRGGGYYR
jgi:hypothetical protein